MQLVILKILKAAKAKSSKKYVTMLRGRKSNDKKYKRKLKYYRGWIDTSLIVATLILAVAFAAGKPQHQGRAAITDQKVEFQTQQQVERSVDDLG
ncbi:hypothetical protein Syun_027401 [Stephania yunnanensis]|uniref:Uncharacterized protein n=1 Tax=Stephania yunnanensis TaxID=152371 RepID=A0AAP0HR86_9MAGN